MLFVTVNGYITVINFYACLSTWQVKPTAFLKEEACKLAPIETKSPHSDVKSEADL